MNRKDRRKQTRLSVKEPVLTMKETEIKDSMRLVKKESTKNAAEITSALFALVLNSEFGFGSRRLNIILEKVNKQIECVLSGHLSGGDIVKWCKEKNLSCFEME